MWLLNRHGEQFWIGWTLFSCCGRVFFFLGGTVVYVGQLFHAGHSRVKFGAHSLLRWREPRMSSNLACLVESRKHFWIYYVSSSLVHFPGHKSDQNLSQFLTSNFLLVLFSNCTKHSSFKTTNSLKITGQAVAWPAVWIWRHTHTHTRTYSRTHLVLVSNAFPYIYIFPFILTHTK